MLSKSQARAFFLTATAGFSGVFLWLTVDSMGAIPNQSHEELMSDGVVRGKTIWEQNNCMGCHTILGEGAYYAPELTRAYSRRGPEWLRMFLRDPQSMYPGQRKMVQYHFSESQINDVISFLKWIGEIDTNGFPADPDMAPMSTTQASMATTSKAQDAPPYFTSVCQACHTVAGSGGTVGPALDGVANRYSRDSLDQWLQNPQAIKPGTTMPNLNLDEQTRTQLVDWLMTQK